MLNRQRIVFIGPMGAGKTTIGKRVAQQLDFEFYDSDRVIEERTGASIPLIFDLEGEAGFRKRETEVLTQLVQKKRIVLATGGGAILSEKNRNIIANNSFVIFLNASLEHLYNRTCKDKNRPLLQTEDPKKKLNNIINERLPIYKSIADLIVFTDNHSINQTVKEIIDTVK